MTTYKEEEASTLTRMQSPNGKECTKSVPHDFTPPRTPTTTASRAHEIFSEIQDINTTLSSLSSLAPGEQTNDLLTRLVHLCIAPYPPSLTTDFFTIPSTTSLCTSLRPLCATAEGLLESHWAHLITHSALTTRKSPTHTLHSQPPNTSAPATPCPKNLLLSFPYYNNYIDLSRLECSTLDAFLARPPANIAFVGSGPLPLSSLGLLDRYPGATVWNVDRDEEALRTSAKLCEVLGYTGMRFVCEDVTEQTSTMDWAGFEVVFLAALVGIDAVSKMGILAGLAGKLAPGALVVARSARGLREVLYPVSGI
jgi:nicotianamine synthase